MKIKYLKFASQHLEHVIEKHKEISGILLDIPKPIQVRNSVKEMTVSDWNNLIAIEKVIHESIDALDKSRFKLYDLKKVNQNEIS